MKAHNDILLILQGFKDKLRKVLGLCLENDRLTLSRF